jgi:putative sterol carrier protein
MADATADFFAELARRGHEPLLKKATGTLRFDITGERPEHWLVDVKKGNVTVSRSNAKADCVMRADRKVFDRIAKGEANALAATLRGTAVIEGNLGLLATFQRLLPGPPRARSTAHAERA